METYTLGVGDSGNFLINHGLNIDSDWGARFLFFENLTFGTRFFFFKILKLSVMTDNVKISKKNR